MREPYQNAWVAVDGASLIGAAALMLGALSVTSGWGFGGGAVSATGRAAGACVLGLTLVVQLGYLLRAHMAGRREVTRSWASASVAVVLLGTVLAPLDYAEGGGAHPLVTWPFYTVYACASGVAAAVMLSAALRAGSASRGLAASSGLAAWMASRAVAWGALAVSQTPSTSLAGLLAVMDLLGTLALWRGLSAPGVPLVRWLPLVVACLIGQPDLAAIFTHDHRASGVALGELGAYEWGAGRGARFSATLGVLQPGGTTDLIGTESAVQNLALTPDATVHDLRAAARGQPALRALVLVARQPSPAWVQARLESAESASRTAFVVPVFRSDDERAGIFDPSTGRMAPCHPLDELAVGPLAPQLASCPCLVGLPAFEGSAARVDRRRATPRYWPAFPAPTLFVLGLGGLALLLTRLRRGTARRAPGRG